MHRFLCLYTPVYTDYIKSFLFFFNDTATTEIYTLSLHDALPIFTPVGIPDPRGAVLAGGHHQGPVRAEGCSLDPAGVAAQHHRTPGPKIPDARGVVLAGRHHPAAVGAEADATQGLGGCLELASRGAGLEVPDAG